ncbi:substrate-binding domain-containing protein [Robbsia sp. KACC 23696]|uniref:substrate-binding domain-containing protein n=1 Tax=Robbsia sp. KACC 23696 TaxID=3149231 RepID=UPI00325B0BDC
MPYLPISRVTYTARAASIAAAFALFTSIAHADGNPAAAPVGTIDITGSQPPATVAAVASGTAASSPAAAGAPATPDAGTDHEHGSGGARNATGPRLRVVVPTAYAYAIRDVARTFTAHTGLPVTVHVTTAGNAPASVREGSSEPADAGQAGSASHGPHASQTHAFDIVIATEADIAQMLGQGLIAPHSGTALPKVGIGLAVPKGQAIPDIRTIAALRRTLLAAHTVVFEDPAMGGPSGANVVKLFDRLGVADRMKSRSKMVPADDIRHALTHAHADLVIEEARLLRDAPGVQYVGELPAGVQYFTRYAGAVTARSTHPTESRALLSFIAAGLSPQLQRSP